MKKLDRGDVTEACKVVVDAVPKENKQARDALGNLIIYITRLESALDELNGWRLVK